MAANRPTVLIVDDEEEHLRLLAFLLRREYDVQTAGNSRDALERARQTRPDVILSDQQMPGGNGLQLLEELHREGIDALSFLVSAYDEQTLRNENRFTGNIFKFVQKPIDPDTLRSDMRQALQHRSGTAK